MNKKWKTPPVEETVKFVLMGLIMALGVLVGTVVIAWGFGAI